MMKRDQDQERRRFPEASREVFILVSSASRLGDLGYEKKSEEIEGKDDVH